MEPLKSQSLTINELLGKKYINLLSRDEIISWAIDQIDDKINNQNIIMLASMTKFDDPEKIFNYFNKVATDLTNQKGISLETCILDYAKYLVRKLLHGTNQYRELVHELYKIWVNTDYDEKYQIWNNVDSAIIDLDEGAYPYTYEEAYSTDIKKIIIKEAEHFIESNK